MICYVKKVKNWLAKFQGEPFKFMAQRSKNYGGTEPQLPDKISGPNQTLNDSLRVKLYLGVDVT